jgi:selenocysteine lyase/cysteine desulfurase
MARSYAESMPDALNWNRAATCDAPAPGVAEAMIAGLTAADGLRGAGAGSAGSDLNQVRALAADTFGFAWPDRVIFCPGATYALNQAVHNIADGATVLVSALEHNSLLRPLHHAQLNRQVQLRQVPITAQALIDITAVEQELKKGGVDWIVLSLASNVFGTIQPVSEVCSLAREFGVQVILDLCQGGGQLEVDLNALQPAYAIVPGHKALHGPRGVGLLFVHPSQDPKPLTVGGTGSHGENLNMPSALPARLEAGTPNMPGILGLGAALNWRRHHPADLQTLRQHMQSLEGYLRSRKDVRVFPPKPLPWSQRLGILSFEPLSIPPTVLVATMAQFGLHARAGMMCAAWAPRSVQAQDGFVRLSPPETADAAEFEFGLQCLQQALQAFAPQDTGQSKQ